MTDAILQFPKPGVKPAYRDATAAYENLEDCLLDRTYGPALRPAAGTVPRRSVYGKAQAGEE